ncbi:MAG: bifunctional folylpolyglutamate synthase/dihydrofolate synthase [Clostridia bacterium]|nr:bifunctional folylpolyglutamate synthase/dihydrofolate synthase [Clostridia bacterium]
MIRTEKEAIAYIHEHGWKKTEPGLTRIEGLLRALGSPQDRLHFVHVAGTNGKGSVCAMLARILREANYQTGLFISPYLINFRERIQLNGRNISSADLIRYTDMVRTEAEKTNERYSEFELILAIGLCYYADQGVQIVVLETGLGGRLDPTNVIPKAELCVITEVDMDHMEILGHTEEAIAREKAGIIKERCPVLYGGSKANVLSVIRTAADEKHAVLYEADHQALDHVSFDLDRTRIRLKDGRKIGVGLKGPYQVDNVLTVLAAVQVLRQTYKISDGALRRGFSNARWPGRFEFLSLDPPCIFDGGHNVQGVTAAVEGFKTYYPGQKACILTAVMADKDYRPMAEKLKEIAGPVVTVDFDNPRVLKADMYAETLRSVGLKAVSADSVLNGIQKALLISREKHVPILIVGSLYFYAPVKKTFKQAIAVQLNR